VVLIAPSRG